MASVGVFAFPSAITSSSGNSTNNPIPPAGVVKPVVTPVPPPTVCGSGSDTPPVPAAVPVTVVPTSSTASGAVVSNGMTSIETPLISMSPTPESVSSGKPVPTTIPTSTAGGPLFTDVFTLVDSVPFDDLESDSNGARSSGSVGVPESTNGYPLENGSLSECMEQDCTLCENKYVSPRVLSCLHVFCESCLDKLLDDEAKKLEGLIECPTCKQPTKVGPKGVGTLHQDYILTNVLDLSTIEPSMLACTSCKSKEMAISRCNDCANFLCASCDNAHRYMRCFEDHKVVQLEDLRKSSEKVAIHKPLYCSVHPPENLKYFCFNCQIPVCNECLIGEHKGKEHNYQIISEAEKPMRLELENIMKDAKAKIDYCNQTTTNLDAALHDLQNQFETARDLINESFQSFKAVLEKCRDNALKNLDKLHSERELKIMDLFHNVEKSTEKIENTAKFTKKVLEQANGPELLSLKKMISSQFSSLIGSTPKVDVNFSFEFQTSFEKFDQIAPELFGSFHTEASPQSPKETTPPPSLPGMAILINKPPANNSGSCGLSQGPLTGSVTASSPISLPTSMQSSFDGDISNLGASYMLPHVLTPEPPVSTPITNSHMAAAPATVGGSASLPGLTSIAEYNLHRLANLAETSNDITDAIVPVNSNPTTNFTLADLISGDQNAFQALAKYGLNNPDLQPGTMMPPHPNMDNLSLLNDFSGLPGPASAMLQTSPMSIDSSLGGDMAAMSRYQVNGRTKATPMQIRCKFGSLGQTKGQFNSPHGFCLGVDEEIVVADTNNHRIEIFEKTGTFKFSFGVPGKEEGQLFYPRKVAVMRSSAKFVVCDRGNERSRMQIFSKNGHFIKKIAIRYIDIVAGLAVTNKGLIVAVDSVSPTVFIISEDGNLIHWFDCSDFMREPSDIAINGSDFYVCDFKGHCVAVFSEDGTFKYRIGSEKVTCFPNGIDISDAGDVLIGDSHGNRFHVACYSKDGQLQSEYECPYVKVSRCCGLKITSEGYVVTLAKNNHHVLVLNTLYIQ
ncbi:B-box type zinc finger protein ncl-1-like [Malaya genurostris]|uniref:B-box type zinc finger protein ncl-1-like n=1 Tax=Malaya genurostris TaxID=325434 RepID=UPI0026F3B7AB|nr:B-box type zinc finger protein ncl-1-like [Malaya genurostris]XP_058467337.1 B-box type zinc finger protein ncl-1-like [Malaya genurostris]XP_058467338.1 B-box type zinc finger protein ncl-1-like [Malaya genurostris]XP_058467339.1 B-box type zinc finger protein ncl-1-like [Malaya genurostris]